MFEQTFRNIDDILYKYAGPDSELDYIGQTSRVMYDMDKITKDKLSRRFGFFTYCLSYLGA